MADERLKDMVSHRGNKKDYDLNIEHSKKKKLHKNLVKVDQIEKIRQDSVKLRRAVKDQKADTFRKKR